MEVDVVIPTVRSDSVQWVLYSLSKNTVKPDLVTIVSNDIGKDLPCYGLKVRLVQFNSTHYPIGQLDVALRRNVGIWSSPCSHIITFDDDQLAPHNMIRESVELLKKQSYFWGHHRYIDFSNHSVDEIILMAPEKGRSREKTVNAWHYWYSCYGGLFGAERTLVQELGGFDMAFSGRHGGEDQNLGRRLIRAIDHSNKVFIHEPPFAWHPEKKIPYSPSSSNLCSSKHQISRFSHDGLDLEKCDLCPYFKVLNNIVDSDNIIMRFDPKNVEITEFII